MGKFIVGLIIGIAIGVGGTFFRYEMQNFMKTEPEINSFHKLKDNILGYAIPDKAYNIEYYCDNANDYTCWLAFSATDQEIEATINQLAGRKDADIKHRAEPRLPPKDKYGYDVISGWPEDTSDFEIYYGEYYLWIRYDKKNSRLYVYDFST